MKNGGSFHSLPFWVPIQYPIHTCWMWWSPCQPSQPSQPSPRDRRTPTPDPRRQEKEKKLAASSEASQIFAHRTWLTWFFVVPISWIFLELCEYIYVWICLIMMSNDSLWLMIQTYSNIFWWVDSYLDNILIDLIWFRLLFKGFNGRAGTWRLEQVETCHTWRSSVLRIGVVSQLHNSMEARWFSQLEISMFHWDFPAGHGADDRYRV